MGYAWIFNYKKDPDLLEFLDFLNCLENGILKRMMEEEPAKTTETEIELPSENMEKSKMTEEEMNNIAEIVSQNQKTYLLKIEARLQGIECSIAANKEMTE
eukprot:13547834-Heterocapsa_arctica.AAC.1